MNNQHELKSNVGSPEANAIPEYATVAAKWWAKAIMRPKFDNGDKGRTGDMTSMLAMLLSSHNPVTNDQADAFEQALTEAICAEVAKYGSCYLDVDYHPDRILYEAAQKAGITSDSCFPWKTTMRVSKDYVSVSAGYAAPHEKLWEA